MRLVYTHNKAIIMADDGLTIVPQIGWTVRFDDRDYKILSVKITYEYNRGTMIERGLTCEVAML